MMSKMSKIILFIITISLVAGIFFFGQGYLQKPQQSASPSPLEKITLGYSIDSINAPILIAQENGYFRDQGLEVESKIFQSGQLALQAMLKEGTLDAVTVAPLPIVINSDRQDFSIISTIVTTTASSKIIARTDKGIRSAKDLKGKKIATIKGTSAHFFLTVFLLSSNIPETEVEIIGLKPDELLNSLKNGQVDAISIWEPIAHNALEALKGNSTQLTNQLYRSSFNVVATKNIINSNPEALKKLLKALDQANQFIKNNKSEAQNILASRMGIQKELAADFMGVYTYELSLNQSLPLELEDGARWALQEKLTQNPKIPNFLDFIYIDSLKEVKPEAVTIIK
jgi:ABC-type nitrate/sulfonate/bicarbonate transport system substrate-binding protein